MLSPEARMITGAWVCSRIVAFVHRQLRVAGAEHDLKVPAGERRACLLDAVAPADDVELGMGGKCFTGASLSPSHWPVM